MKRRVIALLILLVLTIVALAFVITSPDPAPGRVWLTESAAS